MLVVVQSPLVAGAGDSCYYHWTTLSSWGGMYAPAVMTPWQLLAYHVIGVVTDGWCLRPFHCPQQPVLEAVIVTIRRCWGGGKYVPDRPDGVDDAIAHGYCWCCRGG